MQSSEEVCPPVLEASIPMGIIYTQTPTPIRGLPELRTIDQRSTITAPPDPCYISTVGLGDYPEYLNNLMRYPILTLKREDKTDAFQCDNDHSCVFEGTLSVIGCYAVGRETKHQIYTACEPFSRTSNCGVTCSVNPWVTTWSVMPAPRIRIFLKFKLLLLNDVL